MISATESQELRLKARACRILPMIIDHRSRCGSLSLAAGRSGGWVAVYLGLAFLLVFYLFAQTVAITSIESLHWTEIVRTPD